MADLVPLSQVDEAVADPVITKPAIGAAAVNTAEAAATAAAEQSAAAGTAAVQPLGEVADSGGVSAAILQVPVLQPEGERCHSVCEPPLG